MKTATAFRIGLFLVLFIGPPAPCTVYADNGGLLETQLQSARAAGVDDQSLDRVVAAAHRLNLENKNTAEWVERIRRAAQEGLPTAPLVSKIEEGASKRVTADRIDKAVLRLTQRLQFAKALTAPTLEGYTGNPERIMVRMSELLSAGITRTEMKTLYESWTTASLEQKLEAITFYTVTKQAGLEPSEARRIASAGIAHNHFHSFPLELAMMIKAAKANHIESSEIVDHALKIIRGEQTVAQAHRQMGIQQMHPNPQRKFPDARNTPGLSEPRRRGIDSGSGGSPDSSSGGGAGRNSTGSGTGGRHGNGQGR